MLIELARKAKWISNECRVRLRAAFNIPVEKKYSGFYIRFPPESRILEYQRNNARYDCFLPHLAKYIEQDNAVIDVGANVGGTLAGMAEQNDRLEFVCVEADDVFFSSLLSNIGHIEKAKPQIKIHPVKALAGQGVVGAVLEGKRGTKNAVIKAGGALSGKPLDDIVAELPVRLNIRLIKSDVDGFDYDVINSAIEIVRSQKPMIFFECQLDNEYQKAEYQNTFNKLSREGYSDWTFFDNFGEILIRTGDLSVVGQLLRYIWQQNLGNSTRTIYYYDVLAVQNSDKALIDRVLADYEC